MTSTSNTNSNTNSNSNSNQDSKQPEQEQESNTPVTAIHTKSRTTPYSNSTQPRLEIKDSQVKWNNAFNDYKPPFFTHASVLNHHIPDASFKDYQSKKVEFAWNKLEKNNKLNRASHHGEYQLDAKTRLPLNPCGRTGLAGRGWLWRWGPNHAADPIVTRWLKAANNNNNNQDSSSSSSICKHETSQKPILQFVAIERRDGGGWAIPGGMVDAGENVSATLKREFGEESLNSLELNANEKQLLKAQLDKFFTNGVEIYKGYVDDPRNTDNAWMETVAVNFHDNDGSAVGKFALEAGDDAGKVKWMNIDSSMKLYASHHWLIKNVAQRLNAHW